MMFDNDFDKCVTPSQCEEVYKTLELRTPIESRVFLKRAMNKRMEDIEAEALRIEAEQKTESLRRGYLSRQQQARSENRIRFGEGYDAVSHNLLAVAVAASMSDFYVNRPRAWLAKYGQSTVCSTTIPKEAKQLVKDFRETVKEFESIVKTKKPMYNPDGEDTRYNVAL